MQYKKQCAKQKQELRWKRKRNKLVQKLLDKDPMLLGYQALEIANRMMRGKK